MSAHTCINRESASVSLSILIVVAIAVVVVVLLIIVIKKQRVYPLSTVRILPSVQLGRIVRDNSASHSARIFRDKRYIYSGESPCQRGFN